jgi:hypothetical protein
MAKPDEIVARLDKAFSECRRVNPSLQIVLTVSPVRHWKDGYAENSRSKASLLLAVGELVNDHDKRLSYFPAYEIMMDDLRDYRFYDEDMLHPSQVAVDYVWGKMVQFLVAQDDKGRRTAKAIRAFEALHRAKMHRPMGPETEAHRQFSRSQLKIIEELEVAYPYVDISGDKKHFLEQLHREEA